MPDAIKQAHAIIEFYKKSYKEKYGENPILNRNKLKYLIKDALADLSPNQFKELIKYYLRVELEPSLLKLCYEYDELMIKKEREKKELKLGAQLRRETRERVENFRRTYTHDDE